jgi:8-oxo-dGTP pyrophosphatase MutT (NUDIX family)
MSELLKNHETVDLQERFKQASLELLRQQLQSGLHYPGYPTSRLTINDGIIRLGEYGRLYLPNGKWHVPNQEFEYVTAEQVDDFYQKGYALDSENRPLHPWISEMLEPDIGVVTGRGFYRHWGANYTADPVIFRHDQAEPLVLLIQRNDTGQWALPGGFIDPGETAEAAAMREGEEETLIPISHYSPVNIEVYSGPVVDLRVTANAWPSTTAFAVHLNPHQTINLPTGFFRGNPEEVKQAGWFNKAAAEGQLFGSHRLLIEQAFRTL